jgi:outer membrane protein assembly factor BamB
MSDHSSRPAGPIGFLVVAAAVLSCAAQLFAADWPTWRYDANRSAASPQELPARLHLQWTRSYTPQKQAWPDQPLMTFDAGFEPIVLGTTMYLGSSRTDSLTAIDTRTGTEKWRFHAEGPIRFAPLGWEQKIYFVSDDGYLYCLDAQKGALLWRFRGGPSDRKILGNERLISTWPARGAPVIAPDGTIYFAASIWPFMGVFIHALDARTGKVIWTNDGDGSIYMKQPHSADSFAGVAPQGPMALIGDKLLVTGGRSVPACYDRKTGKLIHYLLNENNKKGGGSMVAAIGPVFFNGGFVFELKTGKSLASFATHPVLTADTVYGFMNNACRSFDLKNAEITPPKWKIEDTGSFDFKNGTALIKAGGKLFVGARNKLIAVSLPLPSKTWPDTTWEYALAGTPTTIIAADDRLFVVTLEGQILCFGKEAGDPLIHPMEHLPQKNDQWTKAAIGILDTTKIRDGYCICWGVGSGRLVTALARRSKLHIIAIEPDADKVEAAREILTTAELYGDRVAIIHADPMKVELPPYLANLMVSEDLKAAGIAVDEAFTKKAFHSLRPFGGVACLPIPNDQEPTFAKAVADAKLPKAVVKASQSGLLLIREGALPGSDNWTHEHADAANTRVSTDDLVKAPLGVLWFGGPTNDSVLPRHGHGPQPQVIDGRLIIEGVDQIRAIDIYTGRLLWESKLPGVGAFYDNLAHQPGANSAGTNFISTSDSIYVAYRNGCIRLDPATGRRLGDFKLPDVGEKKATQRWGYINVVDNLLIGGADPLFDPAFDAKRTTKGTVSDTDPKPKSTLKLPTIRFGQNDNLSASRHLVVMDRFTGKVLWTTTARYAFRHNGICAGGGRLYAIDRLSGAQLARLKKNEDDPEPKVTPRILAFDLKTGAQLWQNEDDVFGTWLSYSEKFDVLVEAGRVARDTLLDEPKGMRAFRAKSGVVMWRDKTYLGPAMIHGDTILKDRSACDLMTGEPKMRPDPLTGEPAEWTWVRNYGCNTPLASQHLMTFRSGAAGYLDLCNDGGTGNFGGFRSSCTNNLIVAGGVLCAPEYTRTCTCSYQNQSSICLVNMPEAEMWTSFGKVGGKAIIRRVGVNIGAPGDRKSEDGTLWLEFPSVGGMSPPLDAHVTGKNLQYFRKHSSRVEGPMNWVTSSGISGLEAFTVTLGPGNRTARTYTVRLLFAEPEEIKPGERIFNVEMQGKSVLEGFDVAAAAGGTSRTVVKEFKGVSVAGELKLLFKPDPNAKLQRPILCGIEIMAEGW